MSSGCASSGAGDGTHTVLECVGLLPALETALAVVRDGGTVSRVGAPQYSQAPRVYIEEFMLDMLEGRIEPGRVFDQTVNLEVIADGYARWPTERRSRSSSSHERLDP